MPKARGTSTLSQRPKGSGTGAAGVTIELQKRYAIFVLSPTLRRQPMWAEIQKKHLRCRTLSLLFALYVSDLCPALRSSAFAPPQVWGGTPTEKTIAGLSRTRKFACSTTMVSSSAVDDLKAAVLPFLPPERCRLTSPADSLRKGEWFKLICGASFEVREHRTLDRVTPLQNVTPVILLCCPFALFGWHNMK